MSEELARAVSDLMERLVRADDATTLDAISDELNACALYAERTMGDGMHPFATRELRAAAEYAMRLVELDDVMGTGERTVKAGWRAMGLSTVEEILLRLGIQASAENPLTLYANVASFILRRMEEFAHIEASHQLHEGQLVHIRQTLYRDLWDAVQRNSGLQGVSLRQSRELASVLRHLLDALAEVQAPTIYQAVYLALLVGTVGHLHTRLQASLKP